MRGAAASLPFALALVGPAAACAAGRPECDRPFTLSLHEHGLPCSARTGEGIDKDVADELVRRSGCKISVSVMPRSRLRHCLMD